MVHVLGAIVGEPQKLDDYETVMLNQRIQTRFPNQDGHSMQPNLRQVIFLRITVPADCEEAFLDDLKPYISSGGAIKKRLLLVRNLIGKLVGLEPVASREGMSSLRDGWRTAVNVLLLGKQSEEIK